MRVLNFEARWSKSGLLRSHIKLSYVVDIYPLYNDKHYIIMNLYNFCMCLSQYHCT